MNPAEMYRDEINQRALIATDINDHLLTIFEEAVSLNPKLIVELGVRGGESTFVFERVAKLNEATVVSVDIDQCFGLSNYHKWYFVQQDDLQFAGEFNNWCLLNQVPTGIDLLFIDTSHYYDHTLQEIRSWFPLLNPHAKVILHDTNLQNVYFHKDGTTGFGWDNERGVIRALETYFEKPFDETRNFVVFAKEWLMKHYPFCNGLTILER